MYELCIYMCVCVCIYLKVKVSQSCPALWDPMDYIVYGILHMRILEWVTFPFFRGSSQLRDQTQVSRIVGGFFTSWAARELVRKVLKVKARSSTRDEITFQPEFCPTVPYKMYESIWLGITFSNKRFLFLKMVHVLKNRAYIFKDIFWCINNSSLCLTRT